MRAEYHFMSEQLYHSTGSVTVFSVAATTMTKLNDQLINRDRARALGLRQAHESYFIDGGGGAFKLVVIIS